MKNKVLSVCFTWWFYQVFHYFIRKRAHLGEKTVCIEIFILKLMLPRVFSYNTRNIHFLYLSRYVTFAILRGHITNEVYPLRLTCKVTVYVLSFYITGESIYRDCLRGQSISRSII